MPMRAQQAGPALMGMRDGSMHLFETFRSGVDGQSGALSRLMEGDAKLESGEAMIVGGIFGRMERSAKSAGSIEAFVEHNFPLSGRRLPVGSMFECRKFSRRAD